MLLQTTTAPAPRRFMAASRPRARRAMRRIWDVDADALFIALGVLVERVELEGVFREVENEDRNGAREDALLRDAVRLCSKACRFAEVVERLLDRRTRSIRKRLGGCPLSELAGLWLRAREQAEGGQLAALLWALAKDRRCLIRGLCDKVRGDIWVRALRLLGDRRASMPDRDKPSP